MNWLREKAKSVGLVSDWKTLPEGSGAGLAPATEIVDKLKASPSGPVDVSKAADYDKGLQFLKELVRVAESRGEGSEGDRDNTNDLLNALRLQKGVAKAGDDGSPEPDGSIRQITSGDFKVAADMLADLLSRYDAVKNAVSKKGVTAGSRKSTKRSFDRCVKAVRKTVKARKGSTKEGAAIAICTKTVLHPRGKTLKRYRKGRLVTQKRR